jgi:hypothetical protein
MEPLDSIIIMEGVVVLNIKDEASDKKKADRTTQYKIKSKNMEFNVYFAKNGKTLQDIMEDYLVSQLEQ